MIALSPALLGLAILLATLNSANPSTSIIGGMLIGGSLVPFLSFKKYMSEVNREYGRQNHAFAVFLWLANALGGNFKLKITYVFHFSCIALFLLSLLYDPMKEYVIGICFFSGVFTPMIYLHSLAVARTQSPTHRLFPILGGGSCVYDGRGRESVPGLTLLGGTLLPLLLVIHSASGIFITLWLSGNLENTSTAQAIILISCLLPIYYLKTIERFLRTTGLWCDEG
ncbi:hypothetical protein [Rhodospirillum centenum]|uniref:hypothetical protein n=1 Tax=Rhodospirillum centenum TaxID=34018 RepID=UPI0011D0BB89|nr:hypothetical protein [Rhodospirillum centenum]